MTHNITRIIVDRLKRLRSTVIDPMVDRRPIVKITIGQLLNLPRCSVRIGPVTCMDFDALLNAWFSLVSKRSPQVREHFQDPYAILAVHPALPNDTLENRIKHSLAEQFISGFINYAAGKKKIKVGEIQLYALIFTSLSGLAFEIQQRQAGNQAFGDLIREGNDLLAKFSQNLPVKFKISG